MNGVGLPATIALTALSAVLVLALIRVLRGPTLPDRVVGLDLASTTVVALLACYAIVAGVPDLLNAAIAVALVAFLGTIGFATYLERTRK